MDANALPGGDIATSFSSVSTRLARTPAAGCCRTPFPLWSKVVLGDTIGGGAVGEQAGLQKVGGAPLASEQQVHDCIAHARLRYRDVAGLLASSLEAHSASLQLPGGEGPMDTL